MNDGRYDELSWSARCQLLSEQRGRAAAAAAAAAALGASPLCHSLPYISFSTYTALPGQLAGWQAGLPTGRENRRLGDFSKRSRLKKSLSRHVANWATFASLGDRGDQFGRHAILAKYLLRPFICLAFQFN